MVALQTSASDIKKVLSIVRKKSVLTKIKKKSTFTEVVKNFDREEVYNNKRLIYYLSINKSTVKTLKNLHKELSTYCKVITLGGIM